MMRGITISLLLVFTLNAPAQQAINYHEHIDSLQKELNAAKNDSVKARLAYQISDQWSYTDSVKSKEYLQKAQKLSKGNPYLKALYFYYYGNYIYDLNAEAAKQAYIKADESLKPLQSPEAFYFRARGWRNFATLQQRQDDDKAMLSTLIDKALPLAERSGNKELEGDLNALAGTVFNNQNLYTKAQQYLTKAVELLEKYHTKPQTLASAYHLLARNQIHMDSLVNAKKTIDKLTALLSNLPSSVYHLDLYENESSYYRKTKEFDKALNAIDKGILLASQLKDDFLESSLNFNKYKIFKELSRYSEAKEILEKLLRGIGATQLENKMMYYYELSETYAKLNDMPNAYGSLKKMFALWDSAYVEKMRTNIVEIEEKYQTAVKEKEISDLKNLQIIGKEKRKRNNLLYFSIILLLASGITITLLQLRNRKRKEQILQNEIRQMENEKKLSTYEALIDGQEKERNRLATELHDGLGGMLAAVKMNLSKTARDVADINAIIESSTEKLDSSIQELRLIARNLMPPSLRKLGLVNALHDFCEGLKSDSINIIFQSYDVDETKLDENMKLIIYRIMQELITNAVRHSGGSEILADLVQSNNQIQITVEDNGRGFEQKEIKSVGIGLNNIRSRVEYLKGSMNIESNPSFGATITISFFLNNANG